MTKIEWITPQKWIDAAAKVLGPDGVFITAIRQEKEALATVRALREASRESIVLVNNGTETQWFFNLAFVSTLLCFTRGRIHFGRVIDGVPETKSGCPTCGQAFFYFGEHPERFGDVFNEELGVSRAGPITATLIGPPEPLWGSLEIEEEQPEEAWKAHIWRGENHPMEPCAECREIEEMQEEWLEDLFVEQCKNAGLRCTLLNKVAA
jgi:hypothetical protein